MFQGVHTALITPFNSSGVLDKKAYRELCERQIDAGVAGLVASGTTGEAPVLTAQEWLSTIEIAKEAANGRVPVTAGCGTNSTYSTVERIKAALTAGADAALIVTPYYNKPNPAGLLAHYHECAKPGLPIILYHVPGRTGQKLSANQLADLCSKPGIEALKEATGDIAYANELLPQMTIPVLSGDDFTFFQLTVMGGAGVISVVSNVCPKQTVALFEAARDGALTTARELHYKLLPLTKYLFHTTSPIPTKAVLAKAGFCDPMVRLPLLSPDLEVPNYISELVEK